MSLLYKTFNWNSSIGCVRNKAFLKKHIFCFFINYEKLVLTNYLFFVCLFMFFYLFFVCLWMIVSQRFSFERIVLKLLEQTTKLILSIINTGNWRRWGWGEQGVMSELPVSSLPLIFKVIFLHLFFLLK